MKISMLSSFQVNGLGKVSDLCTPHQEYLALGNDTLARQDAYRQLCVKNYIGSELLKDIRDNTYKGMAVENDRFKEELEKMTGRRLKSKKRGRSVGWRKKVV